MAIFLLLAPVVAFQAQRALRGQDNTNCDRVATEGTHWILSEWRHTCGSTIIRREVTCAAATENSHDPERPCLNIRARPAEQGVCGTAGMPECESCSYVPIWNPWSECIAQAGVCGVGSGQMTRECDQDCDELVETTEHQACDVACNPIWNPWSECIAQAGVCGVGSGQMTRECDQDCDELVETTESRYCHVPCAGEWYVQWSGQCEQSRTVAGELCGWGQEEGTYTCPSANEDDCNASGFTPTDRTIVRDCWEEEFDTCPIEDACMVQAKWRHSKAVPRAAIDQWMEWHTAFQALSEGEKTEELARLQLPAWAGEDIAFLLHESVDRYDSQFKGRSALRDFLNPEECMQLCLMQYSFGNAHGWDESWLCHSVANPNINNLVQSGSCWMRNLPVYGRPRSDFKSKKDMSIDTGCLLDMMADQHDFDTLFDKLMNASGLSIAFSN